MKIIKLTSTTDSKPVYINIECIGHFYQVPAKKEYGKEVEDFRVVDYEAISMLNVSATQELYKRLELLEKENEESDARAERRQEPEECRNAEEL